MLRWKLRPQAYGILLRTARHAGASRSVLRRLGWLRYASENGIARTCRHFGISRSTFLRWADRFDPADVSGSLSDVSKCPHSVRVPETDARTIDIIRQIRMQQPLLGKGPLCVLLQEHHGITIAPATVGRIVRRHRLFFADTRSHREKRAMSSSDNQTQTPIGNEPHFSENDDPLFLLPGITS